MKIVSTIRNFFTRTKPLKTATKELTQASQTGEKTCEKLASNVANEASPKSSQVVQNPIYSTKPRPVTEADKVAAQQYFYALKNKTHIKQSEIKELFAKDNNDFLVGAYKYLLKHSGIPESLHPPIINNNIGKFDLAYDVLKNIIHINPKLNCTRAQLFGLLNHELKHWKQNLDILRTENLGTQAIKTYAKRHTKIERDAIIKSFEQIANGKIENMTIEQIESLKELKKLYETDKSAFEQKFDDYYNLLLKEYSKLQKTAIDEMGLIKENSALAKKSKMYFEDFKSAMTEDNLENPNIGLYLTRQVEKEAYLAGDMAETEVTGGCLFSKLKKQYEKIHADKDLSEQLRIGNEENQKRYAKALEEQKA